MIQLLARLLGSRRGHSAAEFALLALPLILLLTGIMEVGRIAWTQSTLASAVEAAARCASINAALCGGTSAVQSYAVSQATGIPLTTAQVTVSSPACGWQVVATFPFTFAVSSLFPYSVTLTAQACYPS